MNRRNLVLLAALALCALLSVVFFRQEVAAFFRAAIDRIASLGPLGPLFYLAIYVSACVAMMPASVLTIGAGAIWGLWLGFTIVLISATIGAAVTFLLGRHVARGWIEKRTADNPKYRSLDGAIGKEGWRLILLARLSPVIPFNILNYSLGLTSVPVSHYLAATFVGMIPGTFLYTYLGTLAGQAAAASGDEASGLLWAFRVLGLAATAGVSVYVAKLAGRALREKTEKME